MTTDTSHSELLDTLQHYLEQTDFAHLTAVDQPDLAGLFSDLAGLKSEVKAESRQFKATLDTLSEALTTLQSDNQAMAAQLSAVAERMLQQKRDVQRALLLDIIDIYDRLSEGYRILQNYKPVDALFKHSKKQDVRFIKSFGQGQEITLKRFEQWLQRQHVYPIECADKQFDAHTMRTLEIGYDATLENGVVLEELRKGFLFEDQVLRLAEVKVNKL
ncbi:MAG: nucleotide exchange factor GrpE [Methylomicrobium sp.]|nr:nucleotide exchange factor GrpE [Methylomicrobium sp.]